MNISQFAGLGLVLIIIAPVILLIGIILVCFQKTRKAGLIILLAAVVIELVGLSICSF